MSFPKAADVGIIDPSQNPLSWKNAAGLVIPPRTESGKINVYSKTLASSFITDGVWWKAALHVLIWVLAIVFDFVAWSAMNEATDKVPPEVTKHESSLLFAAGWCDIFSVALIVVFGSIFATLPQWPVLNAVLFSMISIPVFLILAALPSATRQGGAAYGFTFIALFFHIMGCSLIAAFYLAMITRFDHTGKDLQGETQDFIENLLPQKEDLWTKEGMRRMPGIVRDNWNNNMPRMDAEKAPKQAPNEQESKVPSPDTDLTAGSAA